MGVLRFVSLLWCCGLSAWGLNVAWVDSAGTLHTQGAVYAHTQIPLGSVWKLFVYAYVIDHDMRDQPYVCSGTNTQEEHYCCNVGGSIGRDRALAQSCGLYFDPKRLGISSLAWSRYWATRTDLLWLRDLHRMRPSTQVPLGELLHALEAISPTARSYARRALLTTSVVGYGKESWRYLGTALRYKTYSWEREKRRVGGGAGWLANGKPFWFEGRGSSAEVLRRWGRELAQRVPRTPLIEESCVDVRFFERYPIRSVWQGGHLVERGRLLGKYRIVFANAQSLAITANGTQMLHKIKDGSYRIVGRMGLEEYVARVIDREGNARARESAKALGIAARSYVFQNGTFVNGCWNIADATTTQRVSPSIPTPEARAAAEFTTDMVIKGVDVHYHQSRQGPNLLSWQHALAQEALGDDFLTILARAYPSARIQTRYGDVECRSIAPAQAWLMQMSRRWNARLEKVAGYEPLPQPPQVCELTQGNPYADQNRLRIYVRGWYTLNDRLSLAHEYVHLALRYHPNGRNEAYTEDLARQLLGVSP